MLSHCSSKSKKLYKVYIVHNENEQIKDTIPESKISFVKDSDTEIPS